MKTTTDARNWHFHFTITDLGLFLGKSPVTLRGWDRKGFIHIPRDGSGDRRVGVREIQGIAEKAYDGGRISKDRRDLVRATTVLLELIEKANR